MATQKEMDVVRDLQELCTQIQSMVEGCKPDDIIAAVKIVQQLIRFVAPMLPTEYRLALVFINFIVTAILGTPKPSNRDCTECDGTGGAQAS